MFKFDIRNAVDNGRLGTHFPAPLKFYTFNVRPSEAKMLLLPAIILSRRNLITPILDSGFAQCKPFSRQKVKYDAH